MGKLKKSLENKKGKRDAKHEKCADEISLVESINENENKEKSSLDKRLGKHVESDANAANKRNASGLVSKVRFKAAKRNKVENKLLKINTIDKIKKEKYDSIKDEILKQIKAEPDLSEDKKDLNYVSKRQPLNRVTNAVIRSLLKKENPINATDSNRVGSNFPRLDKQIKKKEKKKFKKDIWNKKIELIKKEAKDNADKVKREKTVITGDINPIMESLKSIVSEKSLVVTHEISRGNKVEELTKRQKNELNKKRQLSKSIQRESIRNKKAQEDVSLFGQLLSYNDFVQNPIETLKKLNK